MTRYPTIFAAAVLGALIIAPAAAQKSDSPETMLEEAQQKEALEGDLTGAIKQYESIVAKYEKADRRAAVKALLLMAQAHQRLGDAEARKIYERVVQEFGDQPEAVATAKARLGSPAGSIATNGVVNQQIWTGPKVILEGTVSGDGRYLSFPDWESDGNLALHDFITGLDRRLTSTATGDDHAEESAISRDGTQVAYTWNDAAKNRYLLRVLRVSESGESTPRTILDNPDVDWVGPYNWSPDGQWLAVSLQRKDHVEQIGLVRMNDGMLKVLETVGWQRGPRMMAFSTDGRFIAYDLPTGDAFSQRDIYVMSTDASGKTAVVSHPADDLVVGWTPDGQSLLFTSDRARSLGLWSVPVHEGKAAGPPSLLRPDFGEHAFGFTMTASGALIYGVETSTTNVYVAEIDFQTGKVLSAPRQAVDSSLFANTDPDWSSDGKRLVYVSQGPKNLRTLSILSMDTNQVREIQANVLYPQFPRWAPDGSLRVLGSDLKGREGLYRVDPQSGDVSPIVISENERIEFPNWTPDGKRLVYRRTKLAGGEPVGIIPVVGKNVQHALVARDLASGRETELVPQSGLVRPALGPDGRDVAYVERGSRLNVVSIEGGPARTLVEVTAPVKIVNGTGWTPDGRIIFALQEGANQPSYWVIPAAGGARTQIELPRGLNLGRPLGQNGLRVHPDGRHVAYSAGEGSEEVWKLENFLPPAGTAKK